MRGVRKEINYSELCSNAPDKAQLSLGCTYRSCSNGYVCIGRNVQLSHLFVAD